MAGQGVEKYFFQVRQEVTSDWKDLAFFLGFDGPEIDNIDGRNRDDRSRCMDLLQEWKRKNKDAATTEVLMEALSNAGLQSVVHGLKAKRIRTELHVATQPETLTQPQQETMGQPLRGQPPDEQSQPVPSCQPPQQMGRSSRKSDVPARPEGPIKLFIVYGGEDKDTLVEPLAHEIVDQGVPKENVFYDMWSIEHGTSIKESIALAIQDRSYGPRRYFFYIKQEVASCWKDLAFYLGVQDSTTSNIDGRNRDDRSRCMDMLQEWKRTRGETATTEALMKALSDAGLREVLIGLKARFPELTPYFNYIAANMAVRWPQLAANLGLQFAQIQAIKQENHNDSWMCCQQILHMWQSYNGREAKVEDLIQAVRDTGHQDVAQELEIMQIDCNKKQDSC
ncbi:PIDD1 [Branchiostoma lanceolatum]|uniref:PIDD1 protein n=1 Tax=Branchiostoma lanceolatum TaxID=7740 RepID=A0A8K0ECP1_BRALA|nr:PIDD1 [Branchiostoma lanceolatum]